MRLLLLLLALLLAPPKGAGQPTGDPPVRQTSDAPARVLFIGNSLTYENDLPAMIEAVATQAGSKGRVKCRAVALPNFSLEDHWNDGRALRALRGERWSLVVLQQGPSTMPESEASLRTYTRKFAEEAAARGARVALFSVWPPLARIGAFDAVATSYAHAAADVGGSVFRVGDAWRAAWRRDPSLLLYGPDNFHPSPLGSYLAALVFVSQLTGRSALGLPDPSLSKDRALGSVHVTAAQLRVLQDAAAEVAGSVPVAERQPVRFDRRHAPAVDLLEAPRELR